MKPDIRAALFASDPFGLTGDKKKSKTTKTVDRLYRETKKNAEQINLGRARFIKVTRFRDLKYDGH